MNPFDEASIRELAAQTIRTLKSKQQRLVLAESCTGGALAACLTSVPGASSVICGSFVTYREASKTGWLEVNESILTKHTAVSVETSRAMAIGALSKTPEADCSAAVTGHYGPDAPHALDGHVFFCIARREHVQSWHWKLTTIERHDRRAETLSRALHTLNAFCDTTP